MEINDDFNSSVDWNNSNIEQRELLSLLEESRGQGLAQLLRSRRLPARLEGFNLSNMDLRGFDLSGIEWVRCDLRGANLSSLGISNTLFFECNLNESSFLHSRLSEVIFERCQLEYTSFFCGELDRVEFVEMELLGCQFVSSRLSEVDFLSCSLPKSSFLLAQVEKGVLRDCDLTDTLLCGRAFVQERCREEGRTSPVVMITWYHNQPLQYARKSYEVLKEMGATPLLVDFNPPEIDPHLLQSQVEAQIAEIGQKGVWNPAKEVIRSVKSDSPIGEVISMAKEIVQEVDALFIPGGADIEPEIYGAHRERHTYTSGDWRRTILELALIDQAEEHKEKRLLAICRGAQMLAVYNGFQLIQDLGEKGYEDHPVQIEEGVTTAHQLALEIVGREPIWGDSAHHQAVDRSSQTGGGLEFVAEWSGIPKLWASRDGQMVGAQFHPEWYGMGANESSPLTERKSANFFRWLLQQPLLA